jgi:hypothetical protein
VQEVENARVWGGIHYRTSTQVGERMGRQIGRLVVTSVMKSTSLAPVPAARHPRR